MSKKERESFELEAVYDEKVAPLMTQIIAICREHNMPMFASFAYKANADGVDFCTTMIVPPERPIEPFEQCLHAVKTSPGWFAITIQKGPVKETTIGQNGEKPDGR